MLDVDAMSAALNEIQYVFTKDAIISEVEGIPRKCFYYKAWCSSADVEHFLILMVFKGTLTGAFGFRNPAAEEFAHQSIGRYGGGIYRNLQFDMSTSCTMSFDMAHLVHRGKVWSFRVRAMPGSQLAQLVRADVQQYLVPFVNSTATLEAALSTLLADADPCRWMFTNGAIRAAQIVALAMMTGANKDKVRASLLRYSGEIDMAREINTPRDYVSLLFRDWETAEPD